MIQAIKEHRWRDLDLTPRDRALCEVAETLSATPTRMTRQTWQGLRDLRKDDGTSQFDDEACLEVAHVVGLFMYFTRLADGFGLQLDPQVEEAGATGTALVRAVYPEEPPPVT